MSEQIDTNPPLTPAEAVMMRLAEKVTTHAARIAALEAVIEAHNARCREECVCLPDYYCRECLRDYIIELPA